jgi:hypothetical protein
MHLKKQEMQEKPPVKFVTSKPFAAQDVSPLRKWTKVVNVQVESNYLKLFSAQFHKELD